MAKKGLQKPLNHAKIAKVTRIFLAMWRDWVLEIKIRKNSKNKKIKKNSRPTERKGQEGELFSQILVFFFFLFMGKFETFSRGPSWS